VLAKQTDREHDKNKALDKTPKIEELIPKFPPNWGQAFSPHSHQRSVDQLDPDPDPYPYPIGQLISHSHHAALGQKQLMPGRGIK